MTIKALRRKIDELDRSIVDLINARTACALEIGRLKKGAKKAIYSPEREKAVYERIARCNKGPLKNGSLRAIYREVMSAAIALEKQVVISYLGPEATFTHMAAREKFGSSVDYSAADRIADVFAAVERGEADYGVVPIENSIEGGVTHTLDMFIETRVKICAEIYLGISHCLLSNSPAERIVKIYSNPQVFGQCRSWIRGNYPGAELVEVSSTARAAELASGEDGAAAIASELAAEIYRIRVVQKSVEDTGINETRFLVIGKSSAAPSGDDKTSIMVSISDRVGALYRMLYPFKKSGINLTMIESRPSRKKAWDYYFFIDFRGHVENRAAGEALRELEKHCLFVEHLGSYPAAK